MKIHLGCGKRYLPGVVHVDLLDAPHIDYRHDVRTLPMFGDDSAELIYACHVLEYFDRSEALDVLREWRRVLCGLGIPGIDATIATLLAQKFRNVEYLAAASRVQLAEINGVIVLVAQNVMRWFSDPQHRKVIKRLRQSGLNLG